MVHVEVDGYDFSPCIKIKLVKKRVNKYLQLDKAFREAVQNRKAMLRMLSVQVDENGNITPKTRPSTSAGGSTVVQQARPAQSEPQSSARRTSAGVKRKTLG
ncbi:hypothetical protein TWF281_001602 [Arthrobotrys megalospora]